MEQGKSSVNAKGKAQVGQTPTRLNTEVMLDGGLGRSSEDAAVMEVERRAGVVPKDSQAAPTKEGSKTVVDQSRVIPISKEMVWSSYKQIVKKGEKASGIDGEVLSSFQEKLGMELYKLWNRLSSGSYHPPAVLRVGIDKGGGQLRYLGIPTLSDRIAQEVIREYLNSRFEAIYDAHSYGYRVGKSAHAALGEVREQVQRHDWVIDLDIKGFFDNISHELLLKALSKHVEESWVKLYIGRWLTAPYQEREGQIGLPRERGTPQGGVISPLLSNLYLHYALDKWLRKYYPGVKFVRYADDMVIHCDSREQAIGILESVSARLSNCELSLNREKTQIVYCKDKRRAEEVDEPVWFDFLGYRFMPRTVRQKYGQLRLIFDGGMSPKSEQRIAKDLRELNFQRWTYRSVAEMAAFFNAKLRGWLHYYGMIRKRDLRRTFRRFHHRLISWAVKRFKRFRRSRVKAGQWLRRLAKRQPDLFVHWQHGFANV